MIPLNPVSNGVLPEEEHHALVAINSILKYFGKSPLSSEACPTQLPGVLECLREAGLKTQVQWEWSSGLGGRGNLRQALEHFKDGVYFLSTPKHTMALIDNELVDTLNGGNRRKVIVYKVFV